MSQGRRILLRRQERGSTCHICVLRKDGASCCCCGSVPAIRARRGYACRREVVTETKDAGYLYSPRHGNLYKPSPTRLEGVYERLPRRAREAIQLVRNERASQGINCIPSLSLMYMYWRSPMSGFRRGAGLAVDETISVRGGGGSALEQSTRWGMASLCNGLKSLKTSVIRPVDAGKAWRSNADIHQPCGTKRQLHQIPALTEKCSQSDVNR